MTDEEFKQKLGKKLHKLRKDRDLTLHQLATATGAHKTTIMRIERAEINPSANLIRRMAGALEVPITDLMEP
ncbi:helix-turn-helix domain-containing protein [Crocinitomix algicola]|uniref:helix-turn-helix domain-containing protein n=1 Tax=Crocinitomix algicola TaxID=1740263 RepID=UPI000872A391|nr:helix-turn-helix transcriptional regulator [Crocinitomix algicola]